jgi:L-asparaginase
VASSILSDVGLDASALLCGAHAPINALAAALVGSSFTSLHSTCSGKHSGMLVACVANKWPLDSYLAFDHPLQAAIRQGLELPDSVEWGVDGCGVPSYTLSLLQMAQMYRALGSASRDTHLGRVAEAMRAHPLLVAGEGEFDTELNRVTQGRIISKRGGAALACLCTTQGDAIVCKAADGAMDVLPVLCMHALLRLGLLKSEEIEQLRRFITRQLQNVAGRVIGELKAV